VGERPEIGVGQAAQRVRHDGIAAGAGLVAELAHHRLEPVLALRGEPRDLVLAAVVGQVTPAAAQLPGKLGAALR